MGQKTKSNRKIDIESGLSRQEIMARIVSLSNGKYSIHELCLKGDNELDDILD